MNMAMTAVIRDLKPRWDMKKQQYQYPCFEEVYDELVFSPTKEEQNLIVDQESKNSDLVSINLDTPLQQANAIFNNHDIQQLQVFDDGQSIGIISVRDIQQAVNWPLGQDRSERKRLLKQLTARDCMAPHSNH